MTAAAAERLLDAEHSGRLRLPVATKVHGLLVALAAHDSQLRWSVVRRLLAREIEPVPVPAWARRRWLLEAVRAHFSSRTCGGRRVTGHHVETDGRRITAWLSDGTEERWTRTASGFNLVEVICREAKR